MSARPCVAPMSTKTLFDLFPLWIQDFQNCHNYPNQLLSWLNNSDTNRVAIEHYLAQQPLSCCKGFCFLLINAISDIVFKVNILKGLAPSRCVTQLWNENITAFGTAVYSNFLHIYTAIQYITEWETNYNPLWFFALGGNNIFTAVVPQLDTVRLEKVEMTP